MRLLVVEDDAVLREVMLRSFKKFGHRVDVAVSLQEAEHWWLVQAYDAILLDLQLPLTAAVQSERGNALTILRNARQRGDKTPVLILTARDRMEERVAGLDAGADDYLGKPFDLAEVEARLRAMIRRVKGTTNSVQVGRVLLDRPARQFYIGWEFINLQNREFEILWELMTPPGRVINKRVLSAKLSPIDGVLDDNAIEAFISRLRKKLVGSGATIKTLRGLGYVIEECK